LWPPARQPDPPAGDGIAAHAARAPRSPDGGGGRRRALRRVAGRAARGSATVERGGTGHARAASRRGAGYQTRAAPLAACPLRTTRGVGAVQAGVAQTLPRPDVRGGGAVA